jgi:hypothetical protein
VHYLVVAHRTAGQPDLLSCLRRVQADDPGAVFTLLVTATSRTRLMTGHTPALEAATREQLREAGVYLARAIAGDGSPGVAVEDELRARPETYDAVLLCTPPPGRLALVQPDPRAAIEARAGIPVLHAHADRGDVWSRVRRENRLTRWWDRTRLPPAPGEPEDAPPTMRQLVPILGMMLAYLAGGLFLALTVNGRFILNDVIALLCYSGLLAGVFYLLRR